MVHKPGVRVWYRLDENNHRGSQVLCALGWDSNGILWDIDLVPWLLGLWPVRCWTWEGELGCTIE